MTEKSEMDDFKEEVRTEIKQMAASVDKMAGAVQTLVENDIRKQEREDRQIDLNDRTGKRLLKLEEFREDILISRATESSAREFLNKYWPILSIVAVVATAYLTKMFIK